MDLDIVCIVIKSSDVNIPSAKYKLETLDKLTQEQDLESRTNEDGISYIIVDQNTSCPLYDGIYIFNNNEGGLIKSLENQLENQKDKLLKDNLKLILSYYNSIKEEKVL